jgi:very-short-patch-repair endonuclease
MSEPRSTILTSPCKGEVDREAGGRASRFSRTQLMTARARKLRGNMTDAEAQLWRALRRSQLNGFQFRRQHPIGPFTLDFFCPTLRLAIEIDGGQHAVQQKRADERRTRFLSEKNIAVIRYWNNDIFGNLPGVLADLVAAIEKRVREVTPSPTLPLSGGGSTASPSVHDRSEVMR